ncbi:MAG: FkbM family methyltransferase [Terracidiphilus sp.]|jgi:FkbM family methyltransferase
MNAQIGGRFIRPEYIYQPNKLIRRIFGKRLDQGSEEIVELPWKLSMEVDSSEIIGCGISRTGIFEMPVVEAIYRLVDSSDTVLDVGANIGYMTAAALSAGAKKVIAFEPHPVLFARLLRNVERWDHEPRFTGRVNVRNEAIDSGGGRATLFIPKGEFAGNQGIATLETNIYQTGFDKVEVAGTTLDTVIHEHREPIGLLKIDIEGHEFQAFRGGSDSLGNRRIRDIIYEDFRGVDSDASKLLASYGYSIFGLRGSLAGPVLREGLKGGKLSLSEHNLVATLDPDRVRRRMSPRGYKCLSREARQGDLQEPKRRNASMRNTIRNLLSRPWLQPPLAALLRACHAGLNYGGGQSVSDSGEIGALRFALNMSGKAGDFVVFDVGAHDGAYVEAARRVVDSRLRAFSFEPQDVCFEILRARYESDPRVSLHKTAISNHVGAGELFYAEQGESFASLSRQSDAQTKAQKVRVTTVDQFCDENGVGRIQFLKIDTEGQEMEVMQGASRMIEEGRIDFIQFEFGDTFLHTPYHFVDVWNYLSDRYAIYRILRHGLAELKLYSHDLEIYKNANFLSIRRSL